MLELYRVVLFIKKWTMTPIIAHVLEGAEQNMGLAKRTGITWNFRAVQSCSLWLRFIPIMYVYSRFDFIPFFSSLTLMNLLMLLLSRMAAL